MPFGDEDVLHVRHSSTAIIKLVRLGQFKKLPEETRNLIKIDHYLQESVLYKVVVLEECSFCL